MGLQVELLVCKLISQEARKELARAQCPIHKEVPGIETGLEIVELHHYGEKDRSGMYVWDIPREIQIASLQLYLSYYWSNEVNGFVLYVLNEDVTVEVETSVQQSTTEDDLGDLDDHPF